MHKMKQVSVQQFHVKNQFLIDTPTHRYFQSYNSIILVEDKQTGKIALDKNYWDYSNTTGKYRNRYLNEGIAETRKKIEKGVYELINLN